MPHAAPRERASGAKHFRSPGGVTKKEVVLSFSLSTVVLSKPGLELLTVYPSDLTRVTMYIAVKVFVFMGPSVTRSVMSFASSSSAAGSAW